MQQQQQNEDLKIHTPFAGSVVLDDFILTLNHEQEPKHMTGFSS